MSIAASAPQARSSPAPVTTAAEAKELAAHFIEVMDALVGMVQHETDLVRAGHLREAATLAPAKADLTRLYVGDVLRLRANREPISHLAPDLLANLRQRHDTFHALLQINLTVLATAHAVSEAIVRGVSSEIASKSAPQTYGASGRPTAPPRSAATPLAVSRTL